MNRKTNHIYVDADACPFKNVILEVAVEYEARVTMVANYCHEIEESESVEVLQVDKSPEAVDLAIANRVKNGDLVVTQDYGLAALALGKGAKALSPRGMIYCDANIDGLLDARYHAQKTRRMGGYPKGPPRLKSSDREQFRRSLLELLRM